MPRQMQHKTCPTCKVEFDTLWGNKIFCSTICCGKHHQPRKGKILKTCPICSEEYLARNFVTNTGCYQKFCSPECQREDVKRRKRAFREREFQ